MLMTSVGRLTAATKPRMTENAWTTAVAIVMPMRTLVALYRVANAMAISWLLSPSSATKITPKLSRKASIGLKPAGALFGNGGWDRIPGQIEAAARSRAAKIESAK
jgi:hypothetical protein